MGEGILILLGLALVGYILVAPLIALVLAARASRQSDELLMRVRSLETRLWELTEGPSAQQVKRVLPKTAQPLPSPSPQVQTAAQPTPMHAMASAETATQTAAEPIMAMTTAPEPAMAVAAAPDLHAMAGANAAITAPVEKPHATTTTTAPTEAPHAVTPAMVPPIAAPEGSEEYADRLRKWKQLHTAAAGASDAGGQGPPGEPPQPGEEPAHPTQPPGRPSMEEQLGLTWLTRIGAAAFLLGALFFFKYAVDNQWIGPTGRVAIGVVVGTILLVVAEAIRKKTRRRFVHSLIGIGLAVLFVSVWASAVFYKLVPTAGAFVANTALLLVGAAFALRHRGEAILILTLIAGFLNPVVLSTGQDHALELFGYLLLITSVTHAVSVRLHFKVTPWLAILGTMLLFGGWYERYFDASDRRQFAWLDEPPEKLIGPYFYLSSRVVPLVFVGLFSLQWSALSLWLRGRRDDPAPQPAPAHLPVPDVVRSVVHFKALAVVALVMAHVGVTVLLYDSPRALAILAIGLGVSAIALFRKVEAMDLLVVPMSAAFFAFLAVSSKTPEAERTMLVGLLGVWTLVYLIGFLRSLDLDQPIERRAAIGSALGAALFACLSGILLLWTKPILFVLIVAVCSAVIALMASRSGLRFMLLVAAIVSSVCLMVAAPGLFEHIHKGKADPVFLGAVGLWALVHLAAVAEDALRRRTPVTQIMVITASLAALGFLATAILATPKDARTLRALLTAITGMADLALGALLLRAKAQEAKGHLPSTLLLGQALGLFAAAIAFGLSGATVTVLWAMLSVVAAGIAARGRDPLWLGICALLFCATLTRVFAVDLVTTHTQVTTFFDTLGRDGSMTIPVLFNARAYSFAAAGAAFLLSAWLLRKPLPTASQAKSPVPDIADFRYPAALAAIIGYAFLIALVVTEVRNGLTTLPPPPPSLLDSTEFAAFASQVDAARRAQRGSLAMTTTLIFAVVAIALLIGGFIARHAFHRYLGLTLFVITVVKLAAADVWSIERVYQIALLTGVGALLVGGGFLYARFGQRIVALMRDGTESAGRSSPLLVLLVASATLLGATRPAVAQTTPLSVTKYTTVRNVEGIQAPGDYRLDVDLDLYKQSLSEGLLWDVRIAGPDGAEVPYVIQEKSAYPQLANHPGQLDAEMFDPGVNKDGAAHALWSIRSRGTSHCRVELNVSGTTFLRKTLVETGEDPRAMSEVARGPYVYRILQGTNSVENLVVTYPVSRATMVRVTLLPETPQSNIRILGGTVSCSPPEAEIPVQWVPLAVEETRQETSEKTTVVTADVGADGLPLQAIRLDVSTAEFRRSVDVAATTYRAVWPNVGNGTVYRIQPREGVDIAQTRIPINLTRKRWFKITIHDGDSAPLSISSIQGEVRSREIVFRAAKAGNHRLYVGDKMGAAPDYDLADILAQAERDKRPVQATLGKAEANEWFGKEEIASHLPLTERYRTPIGVVLAIGLLGLSLWAVRLLRKAGKEDDESKAEPPPTGKAAPKEKADVAEGSKELAKDAGQEAGQVEEATGTGEKHKALAENVAESSASNDKASEDTVQPEGEKSDS